MYFQILPILSQGQRNLIVIKTKEICITNYFVIFLTVFNNWRKIKIILRALSGLWLQHCNYSQFVLMWSGVVIKWRMQHLEHDLLSVPEHPRYTRLLMGFVLTVFILYMLCSMYCWLYFRRFFYNFFVLPWHCQFVLVLFTYEFEYPYAIVCFLLHLFVKLQKRQLLTKIN